MKEKQAYLYRLEDTLAICDIIRMNGFFLTAFNVFPSLQQPEYANGNFPPWI